MLIGEAKKITGGLGCPTKMPGSSWGIPARACKTGSKLAQITGSSCSICYALKDRYGTQNVAKAQERRLAGITDPRWVRAMITLLLHTHRNPTFRIDLGIKNAKARGIERSRHNQSGWHRWFDSGDLQSVEHLRNICEVARLTPAIHHWLATQELGMVRGYVDSGGTIPENLVIRVSGVMIENGHSTAVRRSWPHTSSVFSIRPALLEDGAHICPAPTQDNTCGSCRACWSPDVAHVCYAAH